MGEIRSRGPSSANLFYWHEYAADQMELPENWDAITLMLRHLNTVKLF